MPLNYASAEERHYNSWLARQREEQEVQMRRERELRYQAELRRAYEQASRRVESTFVNYLTDTNEWYLMGTSAPIYQATIGTAATWTNNAASARSNLEARMNDLLDRTETLRTELNTINTARPVQEATQEEQLWMNLV